MEMTFYDVFNEDIMKLSSDDSEKAMRMQSINLTFSLPISQSDNDDDPNIILHVGMSPLSIKVDPILYVRLTNIWNCLTPAEKFEMASKQLSKKSDVIKNAKLTGVVMLMDNSTKQWRCLGCVLNGSYLYFYTMKEDNIKISFYLLNTTISQAEGVLTLNNKYETISISFSAKNQLMEWKKELTNSICIISKFGLENTIKAPEKEVVR